MNKLLLCIVIIQCLVYPTLQGPPDVFGLINMLYLKADADRNGKITQAELDDIYHGFDQNNDKKITNKEFSTVWQGITQMTSDVTNAYFYLVDFDHSKVIDSNDLKKLYLRFDLNDDGQIEAQEFNLKWQSIYKEVPFVVLYLKSQTTTHGHLTEQQFTQLFHNYDTNNDKSISKSELETGWVNDKLGKQRDADRLFSKLNTDSVNGVSADDMKTIFKRLDLNKNNTLELTEILEMRTYTNAAI